MSHHCYSCAQSKFGNWLDLAKSPELIVGSASHLAHSVCAWIRASHPKSILYLNEDKQAWLGRDSDGLFEKSALGQSNCLQLMSISDGRRSQFLSSAHIIPGKNSFGLKFVVPFST